MPPSRRTRRRLRSVVLPLGLLLALVCLATAAPVQAALEQGGSSFQRELTEGQAETTPSTKTATSPNEATSSSSSSSTLIIVGSIVAAGLIAGIAFLILRDARRVAPAVDGPSAEARSSRDAAARMRRRRARAKAARQQRKRNR